LKGLEQQSEKRNQIMSKKLFVGGLSWDTNDDSLRAAFEQFGVVDEATVIADRETGRSRGFGFVTFAAADSARAAIAGMNDATLDGRTINVNEAQERAPRGGGGGGGFGGGFGGRGGGRGGRDNDRGKRW